MSAALKDLGLRHIQSFQDAAEAVRYIQKIYDKNTNTIHQEFIKFTRGEAVDKQAIMLATYPTIAFHLKEMPTQDFDSHFSYAVLGEKGVYATTVTSPHLFAEYYHEQISSIMENSKVDVIIGESDSPIPLTYALNESDGIITYESLKGVQEHFMLPNLLAMNDDISNNTYEPQSDDLNPLALFTAERVDYSLKRLHHYTGTHPKHFQRFILLTNYQRYVPAFREFSLQRMEAEGSPYAEFVGPGDRIFTADDLHTYEEHHEQLPQMPTYHLKRPDNNGITFINIGVGPSNAKTITDHLAVLRPHCWIMIGHCGGLRRQQMLGDYVLAHAYWRADQVLNYDVPISMPLPALAEIQLALQDAFERVTELNGPEMKRRMRTGTVATTDDRNWELKAQSMYQQLRQSRSIAIDMESATIAANGFRFRVPYGTLLCVSDKPVHGELKMRSIANDFYDKSVKQHLKIGMRALEILLENGLSQLHSRKLRGFNEVIFR